MNDPAVFLVTVVCFLVALLNVAAHFVPWAIVPALVDPQGRLKRLLAFAWGTLTIWFGALICTAVWAVLEWTVASPWVFLLILTGLMLGAGLGTAAAYLIDLIQEHEALRGDVADYEQALES